MSCAPRELVEGRGCELYYLPPYSPELNPIEEAFSKLKALSVLSARDAHGFFEHSGYRAMGQPF